MGKETGIGEGRGERKMKRETGEEEGRKRRGTDQQEGRKRKNEAKGDKKGEK